MAPDTGPEGGPEGVFVAEFVLPPVRFPAAELVNDARQKPGGHRPLELGRENLVPHPILLLHANRIQDVEHPHHPEPIQNASHEIPIDLLPVRLHEKSPIQQLPQRDPIGRKMTHQMLEEEQRMQVRRRQVHPLPRDLRPVAIVPAELLQDPLERHVGPMVVHIQEVVMILHHKNLPRKNGVMMMRPVDINPRLPRHSLVRLLLLPKEPNVDIPARAMLRPRPVQRARVPLEHHHLISVRAIPGRQVRDGFPILLVPALVAHHRLSDPLQQHLLRRSLPLRQMIHRIQQHARQAMLLGHPQHLRPLHPLRRQDAPVPYPQTQQ